MGVPLPFFSDANIDQHPHGDTDRHPNQQADIIQQRNSDCHSHPDANRNRHDNAEHFPDANAHGLSYGDSYTRRQQ
jgi:hypothetical protein